MYSKHSYSQQCRSEFSETEGVITNGNLSANATCKKVHIKINAGEPVTFTCSEFSFSSGNDSYCMIVSSKKGGKKRRGERSAGEGTDDSSERGPPANGLLGGPLSQLLLNREKRFFWFSRYFSDDRERGRGFKKGQKFCDDEAPTDVDIPNGKAMIKLVPNRKRKFRGKKDSKPVLDAVTFTCSWTAN